jgi:hypothetical protein
VLDRETGKDLMTAPLSKPTGQRISMHPAVQFQPLKKSRSQTACWCTQIWWGDQLDGSQLRPANQTFLCECPDRRQSLVPVLNEDHKPDGHQGGTLSDFWSSSQLKALDYETGKTAPGQGPQLYRGSYHRRPSPLLPGHVGQHLCPESRQWRSTLARVCRGHPEQLAHDLPDRRQAVPPHSG